MAYNFSAFKAKVKEISDHVAKEFAGLRTGRASPAVLDSVVVESYGSKMSLREVGNISIEDARTIRITPWDMNQSKEIEKGIVAANLGLSVSVSDSGIRVAFPELTAERREAVLKLAKERLEHAKISLRHARDETWKDILGKEKEGGMSEDERFRLKNELQKLVDEANGSFDEQFGRKEKEILA